MEFFGPVWDIVCRMLNVVSDALQPFEVNITDVECVMDKPPASDGEGGNVGGSRCQFRLEIINRKNRKFILSDIHCKAMCKHELLRDKIRCCDKSSYKTVAAVRVYEPIATLDIEPQSSMSCDIRLSLGGDLSQCDKLVFYYKPDFKYRKIVVWKQ